MIKTNNLAQPANKATANKQVILKSPGGWSHQAPAKLNQKFLTSKVKLTALLAKAMLRHVIRSKVLARQVTSKKITNIDLHCNYCYFYN